MKYVFASDIHGSASACRNLLTRFAEERADRLFLLGDLLYHGPRNDLPDEYAPKMVIEMLNGVRDRVSTVRGNCDCEVDQMVLSFPILADYGWLSLGDTFVYLTHGHHVTDDTFAQIGEGNIVLQGHTHIPLCEMKNGVLHLNPGSVSIPKEGSVKSYMVFDNGTFYWKNVETAEVYKTYSLELKS